MKMTRTKQQTTTTWDVCVSVQSEDDAKAISELIVELGFNPQVYRSQQRKRIHRPSRNTRIGRIILGEMVPSVRYSAEDFGAILKACGYLPASASPILSRLVREGDVERIERNVFQIIEKEETR